MNDEQVSCDCCHEKDLETYVDGKTVLNGGSWANMCLPCFFRVGIGVGIGLGQVFKWSESAKTYFRLL